jgi:DNA primase
MTKEVDRLPELVPHLLLEYKLGILKEEMKEVMHQLAMPEVAADAQRTMEVMKRYKELSEIMQTISKNVGERIVL